MTSAVQDGSTYIQDVSALAFLSSGVKWRSGTHLFMSVNIHVSVQCVTCNSGLCFYLQRNKQKQMSAPVSLVILLLNLVSEVVSSWHLLSVYRKSVLILVLLCLCSCVFSVWSWLVKKECDPVDSRGGPVGQLGLKCVLIQWHPAHIFQGLKVFLKLFFIPV